MFLNTKFVCIKDFTPPPKKNHKILYVFEDQRAWSKMNYSYSCSFINYMRQFYAVLQTSLKSQPYLFGRVFADTLAFSKCFVND